MANALDFAGYANTNGSSDKPGANDSFYYHHHHHQSNGEATSGQNQQLLLDNIYQSHSLAGHQSHHHGALQHHQFGSTNGSLHHHHHGQHSSTYYNLNHNNLQQQTSLDTMSTASASSSPPLSANQQLNIPTSLLANSVPSQNYLNGAPITASGHEYLVQHLHDKKHLRASSAIKSLNGQQLTNHSSTVKPSHYLSSSSSTSSSASSASSVSSHTCANELGNTLSMISNPIGKYYTNGGINHDMNGRNKELTNYHNGSSGNSSNELAAYLSNKSLADMSMNSNDADDMDDEEEEDDEDDDEEDEDNQNDDDDDEMSRNCSAFKMKEMASNGMAANEDNVYVNSLFNSPSSLSSSASNPQLELITVAKSMGSNYSTNRRLGGNGYMNLSSAMNPTAQPKKTSSAMYSKSRDAEDQKTEYLNSNDNHLSSARSHMGMGNTGEKRTQSYGNIVMDDSMLVHLPLRELNKRLRALPKAVAYTLKKRRRTLKNRKYAQNCRSKRLEQKSEMEIENGYLKEEMSEMRKKIEELQRENYLLKANLANLSKGLVSHTTDSNNNNNNIEHNRKDEQGNNAEANSSQMKLSHSQLNKSPKNHNMMTMHSNDTNNFHGQQHQSMMLSVSKQ